MNFEFMKGFIVSSTIILCYKVYSDLHYQKIIGDIKIDELEKRVDSLEDFRLRFYQLYTVRDRRIWDEDESEIEFSEEDEEDEEY